MGDPVLKCPLCCVKTFRSKPELIDHLANIGGNILCPICSNKCTSLEHLIEHLTLDICHSDKVSEQVKYFVTTPTENIPETSKNDIVEGTNSDYIQIDNDSNKVLSYPYTTDKVGEEGIESKMYVELLSKQLMKPCLQTQELKFVKEHGTSRYIIMADDNDETSVGNTVVTKQNNDGTISLTTVKDMKMEYEPEILITQENESEDSQEEIYSCNTCGVSFMSVIDHIRDYHNDQEVVVEEPIDENAGPQETMSLELEETMLTEETDKQAPRRMITETGDIVEAPAEFKTPGDLAPTGINSKGEDGKEIMDRDGRIYTRRYVQVDKLCDSVVKDIKQPEDNKGPYHKVVVKEMETVTGEKVKVYNCVSCHIYVSSLTKFKAHPCKNQKYPCPHCPVAYENAKSLCAHMKVHKAKIPAEPASEPVPFECRICSTMFPNNKSLKLHKRMHDPVKSRPIEPPFENAEGREVSSEKFLCEHCNTLIPIDYKVIHQSAHEDNNRYNCDICNKKFLSSVYLEMHMNVHNIDKVVVTKQDMSLPYRCLYCERRFARPHEKVKHERIHTGEKPHACEICGKSFRVSYCLTLHMRTHSGERPYTCSHCGKRFKAHSAYNHHLLTHSEVRAYKCTYCPKAFKTSVQLAGHKNSHTKPFSCQHCNRPFASLYALRVHTETHARQNNLKFSCMLCGASYARAFALKDHLKQVHRQSADSEVMSNQKDQAWLAQQDAAADVEEIPITKDLPQEVLL